MFWTVSSQWHQTSARSFPILTFWRFSASFKLVSIVRQYGRHIDGITAVCNLITTRAVEGQDLTRLHELFCSGDKPSVELLRNSSLIELFLARVFDFSALCDDVHRSRMLFLLAYASDGEGKDSLVAKFETVTVKVFGSDPHWPRPSAYLTFGGRI